MLRDSINQRNLDLLVGQIPLNINSSDEEFSILTATHIFRFYHQQDCCETVYLDDICGEFKDLIGHKIVRAEESVNDINEMPTDWMSIKHETKKMDNLLKGKLERQQIYDESTTWTFYKLDGEQESVTLRWYGTSNGYYSEAVTVQVDEI